jgi:hypothetical protein
MPRNPPTFKQRDVTAAVKGVEAAGHPVRLVRVSREGAIEVEIGEPVDPPAAPANPWDEAIDQAEAKARSRLR